MSENVVIIEDDEALCEILTLTLEDRHLRVQSAHDGESGLRLVRKIKPRLVVLDVMMPRMNGYEVCAEIQKDPELKDTAIVMTTAITTEVGDGGQSSDEEWRKKLQIDAFISKPYNANVLAQRICDILDKPQAGQ